MLLLSKVLNLVFSKGQNITIWFVETQKQAYNYCLNYIRALYSLRLLKVKFNNLMVEKQKC